MKFQMKPCVAANASFHHFPDQDKGLEEMKRVLKLDGKMVILEINPNTPRGKRLEFCEAIFHTGAKLYQSTQLREKFTEHNLHVLSVLELINPYLQYQYLHVISLLYLAGYSLGYQALLPCFFAILVVFGSFQLLCSNFMTKTVD